MAITAISRLTTKDYVTEGDKDSDDQTVFKLKPLNGLQYMDVIAELRTDENGEAGLTGKGLGLAIKYGLAGWENFNDEDEKELKFNKLNVSKVPPIVLTELAGEIINRSEAGGEERKN